MNMHDQDERLAVVLVGGNGGRAAAAGGAKGDNLQYRRANIYWQM